MAGRFKEVFRQSGVIPVLDDRLVLITSRKSDRWIIPKGYVEKGLSPAESAAKEAYEEAGLIGVVHHKAAGNYGTASSGSSFRFRSIRFSSRPCLMSGMRCTTVSENL